MALSAPSSARHERLKQVFDGDPRRATDKGRRLRSEGGHGLGRDDGIVVGRRCAVIWSQVGQDKALIRTIHQASLAKAQLAPSLSFSLCQSLDGPPYQLSLCAQNDCTNTDLLRCITRVISAAAVSESFIFVANSSLEVSITLCFVACPDSGGARRASERI